MNKNLVIAPHICNARHHVNPIVSTSIPTYYTHVDIVYHYTRSNTHHRGVKKDWSINRLHVDTVKYTCVLNFVSFLRLRSEEVIAWSYFYIDAHHRNKLITHLLKFGLYTCYNLQVWEVNSNFKVPESILETKYTCIPNFTSMNCMVCKYTSINGMKIINKHVFKQQEIASGNVCWKNC